jgi:DNA repair protein RecO (recombination protein O)
VPLKTSEAFVVDVRKLQEADRLVVLFTEDEGKIKGVAPSAAKSRKRFGGKLERLTRVRVTYFEKEGRDLARIDSCDLLEESFTLHQDLRAAALLAYVAEVVDTFAREHESDPRYYRLVGSLLAALRAGGDPRMLARYFEIWTLRLHGLLPDLERCGDCGKELARGGARVIAGEMAEALCASCARRILGEPKGDRVRQDRLSVAALGALARFRKFAPGDLVKVAFPPDVLAEIEAFAVAMLAAFVGHPFKAYRFMRDVHQEARTT